MQRLRGAGTPAQGSLGQPAAQFAPSSTPAWATAPSIQPGLSLRREGTQGSIISSSTISSSIIRSPTIRRRRPSSVRPIPARARLSWISRSLFRLVETKTKWLDIVDARLGTVGFLPPISPQEQAGRQDDDCAAKQHAPRTATQHLRAQCADPEPMVARGSPSGSHSASTSFGALGVTRHPTRRMQGSRPAHHDPNRTTAE